MTVFDNLARDNNRPASYSESDFVFLNRVAGPYWDQVRDRIESWVAVYPDGEKKEITSRIRDGRSNVNHRGALWELYLHAMLTGAGYDVECHPELEHTTRRPDFLATKGDESFYVEARRISGSDAKSAEEARWATIIDKLNTVESPDFHLLVDISKVGPTSPPVARIKKRVDAKLRQLGQDGTSNDGEVSDTVEWEQDGWEVSIRFLPKSEQAKVRKDFRPVAALSAGGVYIVDDVKPLLGALKDKGSAYGRLSKPLVVAVSVSSFNLDQDDVFQAVYGTKVEREHLSGETSTYKRDDGYWSDDASKARGADGILIARDPMYNTWGWLVPELWHNPHGRICPSLPMWRQIKHSGGTLVSVQEPSAHPGETLGLPSPWPEGKPFPDN
ncbi:hypothetical protein ACTG9Q_24705 [Actinokineospora sp. 24-640]